MSEITKVLLTVGGPESESGIDGIVTATVPTAPETRVTLKATVEPPDATVTAWSWKKNDADLLPSDGDEYVIDKFTTQFEGSYVATATAGGESKTSNVVVLSAKADTETDAEDGGDSDGEAKVKEVNVGEYDPVFAYASLVAVVILASMALVFLNGNITVELPRLTGNAPESGTYAERIRAYAVVAASTAGLLALLVGAWLAAVEVRGRVRRTVAVTAPSADPAASGRGTAEDVSKILEAASRVRGTIGVLVSAVALLFGALWAVGQSPDAASGTSTTTITTSRTTTTTMMPPGGGSTAGP